MTATRTRASALLLAAACATAVTMTPAFQSGVRALMAEVSLVAGQGFIMGGTGNPTPDNDYVSAVKDLYLNDGAGYSYNVLTTPEEFCPIVCIPGAPDLTFGDSVDVGLGRLTDVVTPVLNGGVSVLGYSQSATVATVWMNQLLDSNNPNLDNLHVTLLGDPNSAIGGILDRFQFADGTHVPFLNVPLDIDPTPTSGIDTDVYMGFYDGYANFPLDPTNIYAVINALIGIQTVHPYYPFPDPSMNLDINNIINLGTIGGGDTNFYAIPAPLPTLAFLYDGGPAGRFFYDALNPYASLMNNWAYGNPGDPFVGVGDTDAIGPWQVNALGELMESGVAGFFLKMDPLQMIAGMQFAAAQTIIGPTNDILAALGQPELSPAVIDSLLSGYDFTNQLDMALLDQLTILSETFPSLAPEVLFDGSPMVSAQPLIDLVGYGFNLFNFFGA